MCDDPNGTRWSKSSKNVGKAMLQLSGWTEGSGLGKSRDGVTSHVKTQRKDDVTGIGYAGGVQETWSTQSVGFADVLSRIKDAVTGGKAEEDGKSSSSGSGSGSGSGSSDGRGDMESRERPHREGKENNGTDRAEPIGGRHTGMYAKRHALKTELLRSRGGTSTAEILGSASTSRKRACGGDDSEAAEPSSTLRSPFLQRMMQRVPRHEPRRTTADSCDADVEATVRITKPHPRPPPCSDTPFLATS